MSESKQQTPLQTQLERFVGKPVRSSGGRAVAPDPVNQPMIRHWAAAFDDRNPVYIDAEAAAATRWGGIVAPPMMLQTWTMATPQIAGIAERGGSPVDSSADENGPTALGALDAAGFTATLASNSEFEIERYLRLGETVTATTVIESISTEKQTRIGVGHFLTWVTTYTADEGDVVGRQRFRILKFKPAGAGA